MGSWTFVLLALLISLGCSEEAEVEVAENKQKCGSITGCAVILIYSIKDFLSLHFLPPSPFCQC